MTTNRDEIDELLTKIDAALAAAPPGQWPARDQNYLPPVPAWTPRPESHVHTDSMAQAADGSPVVCVHSNRVTVMQVTGENATIKFHGGEIAPEDSARIVRSRRLFGKVFSRAGDETARIAFEYLLVASVGAGAGAVNWDEVAMFAKRAAESIPR